VSIPNNYSEYNDSAQSSERVQTEYKPISELQGISRLAIEAVVSVCEIVESVHTSINNIASLPGSQKKQQAGGIASFVYKNIRGITELVGTKIDVPLAAISEALLKEKSLPANETLRAALNGVLGDHLIKRANPLAIPMNFRRAGKNLEPEAIAQEIQHSNGKLLIMVHGLCMNDLQWQKQQHDHGAALAADLGLTPVYLHYNSGKHISDNGENFAQLLEKFVLELTALYPHPLEITLLTHSMGGLISRSAFEHASSAEMSWPKYLKKLIFLGTPHHGAPLEKTGNWLDMLLGIHPISAPFTRLIQIRSAGITDLRHGNVRDTDWQPRGRFEFSGDKRIPLPLPKNVQCYAIASTTGSHSNSINNDLVGDGLVPVDSALGKHGDKKFTLLFPPSHQWLGRDINHMQLLNHPEVYQVLRNWLIS
jgi:pimeloyl-ACP methyl ester carboxylesterase